MSLNGPFWVTDAANSVVRSCLTWSTRAASGMAGPRRQRRDGQLIGPLQGTGRLAVRATSVMFTWMAVRRFVIVDHRQ